ncbi:MAG: tRNA 4-thiouridine(8) synthase ThiI [Candidatus Omnitrophica bacterium]|nr:tRNA 4-thiouridine(8) synthase ThiI [Candidatus Omnitrophota bacterium]
MARKIAGQQKVNKKAVVLLSGGLDSILAAKLMLELGIDIACVTYIIEFAMCGGGLMAASSAAEALGVPLKAVDITAEYVDMLKKPEHGYGANINPCIDCKILMLKKAKAYMEETGASFLVTGEVLGERPMSQRRDALNIIEKNAGVRGILLRPLSAKLLPPTLPETEGIVDREKLLDIQGRGRKPQLELAKKFGIKEYPNPSGGCLLTDPGFTKRVKDLIIHEGLTVEGLRLLKIGRHFRFSKYVKLIVSRDGTENDALEPLIREGDVCFRLKDHGGPLAILRGTSDEKIIMRAAEIMARHTKYRSERSLDVLCWRPGSSDARVLVVKAASMEEADKLRI